MKPTRKQLWMVSVGSVIAISTAACGLFQGQTDNQSQQQVEETIVSNAQMTKFEKLAEEIKNKKPETIVGEVFENGYLKKHEHHEEVEDGYVFDKKDVVSETETGYIVRHGEHFHFIYKDKQGNPVVTAEEHHHDADKHEHVSEHQDHGGDKDEHAGEHYDHDANKNEATSDDYVSPIPNEKDLTEKSPEVQKYLDYITYAYGIERNTIKLESAYKDGKKETSENATTLKVEETTAPAASTTTETVKPVVTDKAEETVAPATATPASQPAVSASEQPHA